MNFSKTLLTIGASVFVFTNAVADDHSSKHYGGVGYGFFETVQRYDDLIGDYPLTETVTLRIEHFTDNDADTPATIFRLGYQFHSNWSVEGRFGTSLGKGSARSSINGGLNPDDDGVYEFDLTGTQNEKVELHKLFGLYLRGGISVGKFYPYFLAGYSDARIRDTSIVDEVDITNHDEMMTEEQRARIHLTIEQADYDDTETDFSYGVGTDFIITDSLNLNAEWIQYFDTDIAKASGFQLGLAYRF